VASWADATQLTFDRADIETLDVSPDGELLAFSSDRRGNKDLWVMPSAGGPMTQLTTDPTPDWNPRWSPDGSEIAFYAYRTGNRDIWVMPSRGGPARQLTSDPGQDWFPVWSPDGLQIAYQSIVGGAVFVVRAQGEERRRVAMDVSGVAGWSREGPSLIIRKEDGLYRAPTDGQEPQPLPFPSDQVGGFKTSLDGRSLCYVSRTDLGNSDLWKYSFETGEASRLATLSPRRGLPGGFTCGDDYLYFLWREGDGNISVMDVESDER